MAWLNARPRRADQNAEDEVCSRLEQMEADDIAPPMPPCPAHWLVELLMEMGPTEPAGMGLASISWRTIGAWCERTGVDLPPWQAKLIRRLSGDWLSESEKARKPEWPAPWLDADAIEANRAAAARNMGSIFSAMANRPKRRGLR